MNFLPAEVEAEVGTMLQLPLQVLSYADSALLPFSDCRGLSVDISASDPTIFNISQDRGELDAIPEGACLVLTALALNPGHTKVTVRYNTLNSYMEGMVTIAAYLPLVPSDPETVAVVTLGSSKLFVFEGGPLPWILDVSKFYKECE